ncbi:enoyl-[acyl-carrier-protein] reductase [Halothiobacillus diazotrophicus]|uniref:Enoyl-[acyl-carrier-protein] reductase [NADH] n=1 Tax=Halothiobacillus diazotrophicus TaxID=1860122 RepID=A0A191ZJD5_9GAMM|nr:enoyl-ACP reductase [Halothiobacillus diazotrophicus]ANJ67957.1 enoyl-[acyl-carrier-protein] reductase [Halothiobacillus diazotrophicus]
MGFLSGKRALIIGIANNRSIASGIAEAMHREGAELAFTYLSDRFKEKVEKATAELGSNIYLPLDVTDDAQIDALFPALAEHWPEGFDILVHAVAFAPREALEGDYLDGMSREAFRVAHDVSAYSLAALAKAGRDTMRDNGAIVTLSYLGAERAMPNYNVMGVAKAALEANVRYLAASTLGDRGIRVNSISAGPIKTLAASGIADFKSFLDYVATNAPLKRNVTIEQVGNTAAFLCSDLASGITGENIYVDSGYFITGMGDCPK